MLPPDELAELAESIKENGLQNPIVMQRGVLIDGRNRYAACKLANVEPTFTEFEGDADAYIITANINRRHMSAGQRAMAVAMIRPEATNKGGRGKTSEKISGVLGKSFRNGISLGYSATCRPSERSGVGRVFEDDSSVADRVERFANEFRDGAARFAAVLLANFKKS